MALMINHSSLVFIFGILGNFVSFLVFLAPMTTFYKIHKKKSTGGFHSFPYIVALLSCMLWIYYASLKSHEILIITINCIGCFFETIYIAIYILYAPKLPRILALKLLFVCNVVGFGSILVFTHFLVNGSQRAEVLGWVSVILSISVYVAPLSIMNHVIRTKSVEYMPICLSIALLLNSIMWFFYGLLLHDFFIAVPNVVGLIFGLLQIILYLIYKNNNLTTTNNSQHKLQLPVISCNDNNTNNNFEINNTPIILTYPQPSSNEIDAGKVQYVVVTEEDPSKINNTNI